MAVDRIAIGSSHQTSHVSAPAQIESLESRTLLSTISWDGGPSGLGTDFTDPLNWVGDTLPTAADIALINTPGPVPVVTQDVSVASVQSIREMRVHAGGNLRTSGTNILNADITLRNGALTGGSWGFPGSGLIRPDTGSGGVLDDVQLSGELVLSSAASFFVLRGTTSFTAARLEGDGSTLRIAPGYTLNSPIIAEGPATGARIIDLGVSATGVVTIGATGEIRIAVGTGGGLSIINGANVELVNNGLIASDAAFKTLALQVSRFTNNGDLTATNGTLDIAAIQWTNTGRVAVLTGGFVNLGGTWTNSGILQTSQGTMTFAGNFSTPTINLAGFTRLGGTVRVAGQWNNTGNTIAMTSALGQWDMFGGTIYGGQITVAGTGALGFTTGGGTLQDVAVMSDIRLATSGANVRVIGTTTFIAARLSAGLTTLTFGDGYVINSAVYAEGAATGNRNVTAELGSFGVTIAAGGLVQISAGCAGDMRLFEGAGLRFENLGNMIAGSTGRNMITLGSSFINRGTISVPGRIQFNTVSYRNAGTISGAAGSSITIGGTFDSTAGEGVFLTGQMTVFVSGTISNAGNLFELNTATGSWNLAGTLSGGSFSYADGKRFIPYGSSGVLANATMLNDVVINELSTGLTLRGTTTFPIVRVQTGSLTLAPGLTLNSLISFEGGSGSIGAGTDSITIGPNGEIRALGSVTLSSSTSHLFNYGTIANAATSAATVTINVPVFRNYGAMRSTSTNPFSQGGFNILGALWSNSGIVESTLGLVESSGVFDGTGGIGTFNSILFLYGTFLNTGNTLHRSKNIAIQSGTIEGGTVIFENGAIISATSLAANRPSILRNVAIVGDIQLYGQNTILRFEGTAMATAITLNNIYARIEIAGGAVLHSIIHGNTSNPNNLAIAAVAGTSNIATIGADSLIQFPNNVNYSVQLLSDPGMTLRNEGTISAAYSDSRIFVFADVFVNAGVLEATAGQFQVLQGTWSNLGTIRAAFGAPLAGTLITANGFGTYYTSTGPVNVRGTIDNTNGIMTLDANTGSWIMDGGSIIGGIVNLTAGRTLRTSVNGSILSGVAINGDVVLDATGAFATLSGPTTFSALRMQAANTAVRMVSGFVLQSLISAEGAATGNRIITLASDVAGIVSFGPLATVRLATGVGSNLQILNGWQATLQNAGLIAAEAAGRSIQFQTAAVLNTGIVRVRNASRVVIQQNNWLNSGTIDAASGEIQILSGALFTNHGGIVLGLGGLLTVASTEGFAQSQEGSLDITIAGTTAPLKGRVVVYTGSASIDGSLVVRLGNGFVPGLFSENEFLTLSTIGQTVTGQFDQVSLPPASSDQKYLLHTGDQYLRLAATSTADFNSDFTVDFFDYLDFVQEFSGQTSGADFNQDGVVDFFDYLDFLVIFSRF